MIIVRAPLRISFVGGGTDLPAFYTRRPGRVVSTAIDKYVYVVINRTPMIDKISARYTISETVDRPDDLQHTRIKSALKDLGIEKNIEIASFASMPAKTGLGSSSSFSVALLKALHAYQGKKIDKHEAAEAASRLEINVLGEPIGKQDQYAAAFGGFNVYEFQPDGSVNISPVFLNFKTRLTLEEHLLVFFLGTTRDAASVLREQKKNTETDEKKFNVLSQMADSVGDFVDQLKAGDVKALGEMLKEAWARKKTLASNVSLPVIDEFYDAGIAAGAWGGKVLGAGGGGCMLFIVPPEKQEQVRGAVKKVATTHNLSEFREIPVRFVQSGAEVLYEADHRFAFGDHKKKI